MRAIGLKLATKDNSIEWVFALLLLLLGPGTVFAAEISGWKSQWQRTMEAAGKEGKIHIYVTGESAAVALRPGVFQKAYPDIKVLEVTGGGPQIYQRVMAERRAGKFLADVFISGVPNVHDLSQENHLDSIQTVFILPEVVDESKWWQGRHHYVDPNRKDAFMFIGSPNPVRVSFNTKLVSPKDLTSLRGLLDTKWRGKIVALDIRAGGPAGSSMRVLYHSPSFGPNFIRQLFSKMDITLSRDRRQAIDWLGSGKFPVCLFCSPGDIGTAKLQGLPVDFFPADEEAIGFTAKGGTLGLMNKAPHPNASRVFINWLLSREGQMTVQRGYKDFQGETANSLRIDIPKDDIEPYNRLMRGVNYIDINTPSRLDMRPIIAVFEEALTDAAKKR